MTLSALLRTPLTEPFLSLARPTMPHRTNSSLPPISISSRPPSGNDPSVKGVAFKTVMTVLAQARSQAILDAVLARIPADFAEALRYGTIIAAGWYPVAWYRALWSAICEVTGEGQDLVRELGRAAVDHDFSTLYRAMFRMLRPRTLVTTGLRHFSHVYDTGNVEVIESRAAVIRVRWSGCTGFDRNMWVEILGSCERLGELAGAKSPRGSIQAGGDGETCLALFRLQ